MGESQYPGSLDEFTQPERWEKPQAWNLLKRLAHTGQHAFANAAINAVQETLGVDPQGAEATVAARLDVMTNNPEPDTLRVTSTDDATSAASGPLRSDGGLAVAKQAFVGNHFHHGTNSAVQSFVFETSTGVIDSGKRLRVRFSGAISPAAYYIQVRFTGEAASGTRSNVVDKLFVGNLFTTALNTPQDDVRILSAFVTGEVRLEAVGADVQVDLIIDHPAEHAAQIRAWALQAIVVSNRTWSLVTVAIEDIP